MPERILGVSAFYHDSAAALLIDGLIVAAGKVFVSDTDGNVVCFYGASP